MSHADRVLCPSRWIQRELAATGVHAEHVPLAVPPATSEFRRAPAATPLFLYCGRLSREKGVSLLIGAFAHALYAVPDAQLRIVGDGPERAALERLVESLDIDDNVTFIGQLPRDQIEDELAGAWALVAPSLWAEPFGLVVLEAIVHGVPVIASAAGGPSELIEDGVSGLLFPNGDKRALSECIRAVAESRVFPSLELPSDLVDRTAKANSPETHAARIRSIFLDLVQGAEMEMGAS
jgi:glycosyltransferase involved in cell wall biosynthesis